MFVIIKGDDGNTIIQLQNKGVGRIVHQDQVFQFPVLDDSEVLSVHSCCQLRAVLPMD